MPKVLIIDDVQNDLDNLTFILELEDYLVTPALGGSQGVKIFAQLSGIDVVITSMRMPDMTGIDVIIALKKLNPDIAVIILTDHGDMENAVSAMKEGAFDYLNKPIKADKLLISLENAFRHNRLLSENRRLQEEIFNKNVYLQGLHDSAQQILLSLMPAYAPLDCHGAELACISKSCDAVGGDLYDVFTLKAKVFFYIADVCSHGILAAVISMIIKTYFDDLKRTKADSVSEINLSRLVCDLNNEMVQKTPSSMFATLFCGYYDLADSTLNWVSAGHIDQCLLRSGTNTVLASTGTMVGLFKDADFEVAKIKVEQGDRLFLFSDGLIEIWDENQIIDPGFVTNLFNLYADLEIKEAINEVYEDVLDYSGKNKLDDDLTLIGLEFTKN